MKLKNEETIGTLHPVDVYSKDKTNLLESFYSAIGENKKPVKAQGEVIGYWSKELGEEFIKSINSNKMFSNPVKKLMINAINRKGVIPVYTHNLWILDITENFVKIFTQIVGLSGGSIMGFYDGTQIVLMTSNLRDLAGDISSKVIYGILTHEFQHRFAGEVSGFSNDPKVKDLLKKWFTNFIDMFFEQDITPNDKAKLLKFFTNIKSESNRALLRGSIEKRFEELYNMYESVTDKNSTYYSKLERLLEYVYNSYYGEMHDYDFYRLCQKVYRSIGIIPDTWIFQEFLVPSEVICVCASNEPNIGNNLLGKYLNRIRYKNNPNLDAKPAGV
jgi:hypothetical protein